MISVVLVACAFCTQADNAKEYLFHSWTTTPIIANVVVGLPTEIELNQVKTLLAEVVKKTTSSDNTTAQKFMHVMIAGIEMEYEAEKVSHCLSYIESIDENLHGIAGSRVLRFQLRCAQLQGDVEKAQSFATLLREFDGAHVEDAAVLCLYDIERAMQENDNELAQQLYMDFDTLMCASGAQYVRIPVALGYARVAKTQENKVYALVRLSQWLEEFGYEEEAVRELLLSWLSRLQPRIEITRSSVIPSIALLATELATYSELDTTDANWEEITLLVQAQDFQEAILLLEPLAEAAGERQDDAIALLSMVRRVTPIPLIDAFECSRDSKLPIAMSRTFNSTTLQELFQQAIKQTHTTGESAWLHQAFLLLLQEERQIDDAVLAESCRLIGEYTQAKQFFVKAIALEGESVQLVCGLADCTRDSKAMSIVIQSTSPGDTSSYWYWLANVRILQWYAEDGGDQVEIAAKINRLRKKDASLGGAQFISEFNALLF